MIGKKMKLFMIFFRDNLRLNLNLKLRKGAVVYSV